MKIVEGGRKQRCNYDMWIRFFAYIPIKSNCLIDLFICLLQQSKLLKREEPSNRKKTKSIGAVEAQKATYLKGSAASLASKMERHKREDDTMAELMAFRSKVLDTSKEGSRTSSKRAARSGSSGNEFDDLLASRMAKRVHEAREDEALELQNKKRISSQHPAIRVK